MGFVIVYVAFAVFLFTLLTLLDVIDRGSAIFLGFVAAVPVGLILSGLVSNHTGANLDKALILKDSTVQEVVLDKDDLDRGESGRALSFYRISGGVSDGDERTLYHNDYWKVDFVSVPDSAEEQVVIYEHEIEDNFRYILPAGQSTKTAEFRYHE